MTISKPLDTPNVNIENFKHKNDSGVQRTIWTPGFSIKHPENLSLAITKEIPLDQIPSEFQEIYSRFYHLGFIDNAGHTCIFMANLLRRILRLHGIEAYTRQVIQYWENEDRGVTMNVGMGQEYLKENQVDTHVVVVSKGFVLDFARTELFHKYGPLNPKAFIGAWDDWENKYQDFGFHGKACWTSSYPRHPMIKHATYENKQEEIKWSKHYFKTYAF